MDDSARIRSLWQGAKSFARSVPSFRARAVREEVLRDLRGLPEDDPGPRRVREEAIRWLCRAQDRSRSADGGIARAFDLARGWSSSYPETTGYAVPTILEYAEDTGSAELRDRGRRMLDWLASIQLPGGGFQGGTVGSAPPVPVVFNTGQVLLGLAAGAAAVGAYLDAIERAAEWLVGVQDEDGAWRRAGGPSVSVGAKTYHTHVAWGLLEAARVSANRRWSDAAFRNVRWALTRQRPNGWFENCSLDDPARPLTHTLAYAARGIVEAWRHSRDDSLLAAARRTADGLASALRADGFLPGRLRADWSPASRSACLTGTSQAAICWLLLLEDTGDVRYLAAAEAANRYVRRTVRLDGPQEVRGGVKGSFPVWGGYCRFQFPNWACKFTVDANRHEDRLAARGRVGLERISDAPSGAPPGPQVEKPQSTGGAGDQWQSK